MPVCLSIYRNAAAPKATTPAAAPTLFKLKTAAAPVNVATPAGLVVKLAGLTSLVVTAAGGGDGGAAFVA